MAVAVPGAAGNWHSHEQTLLAPPPRRRCPDCVTAEPVIIATLADREGGARVMWCNVLRSEYKDHPEYPYRTHKLISLTSVPTVVKYVDGKVRAACVDDDCSKAARVRALLEA